MHKIQKNTVEINGNQNCLVLNTLENIFFCVQEKKQMHTGLEQHESE